MINTDLIIAQTKKWVTDVIVAHNICPFARREVESNRVRYCVDSSDTVQARLEELIDECVYLDMHSETETTLLIYPEHLNKFDDYLDFLDLANALIIEQGFEGIYQLASFHPDYCFEGETENDPANYTNRSVYPMLHLIREASLEQALKNYPNPEKIPERNIELTRKFGLEKMQAMLKACYNLENEA